jgi:hypothetical protein
VRRAQCQTGLSYRFPTVGAPVLPVVIARHQVAARAERRTAASSASRRRSSSARPRGRTGVDRPDDVVAEERDRHRSALSAHLLAAATASASSRVRSAHAAYRRRR